MANEPASFGQRARRALIQLIVFLLVVGLLAAVTFLLSQLNARRFRVSVQDGNLIVLKGRPLPAGSAPYRPEDPQLREAYAPLGLRGVDAGPLLERTFEDREELDRALFEILRALAEPRLDDPDDAQAIQEGLGYLQRASLLQGLSPEQRQVLARLQTSAAFFRGRSLLGQAQVRVRDGLELLGLAAKSENPHTRAAQQILLTVEAPARALDEALRRAVHQMSGPPASTPPPSPAVPSPAPPSTPDAGTAPPDAG